ncbi:sushi, von Willebrand factor type A, EGF and pentraxin domain-containing protein 1-like [Mercenaria mercenaria]|uniref:sushi, von Willebrand factor type A, EGF and pentraxin domain-containing protein 1-like n=1 Tax=Mercenaria mercenaria TaxID=6596 RepID=UPI00234F648D|nr:sushi, von Willebrand factor type A, EGF and pentraxin domain-containing protein 1-like [Mercenaria mercenaria]
MEIFVVWHVIITCVIMTKCQAVYPMEGLMTDYVSESFTMYETTSISETVSYSTTASATLNNVASDSGAAVTHTGSTFLTELTASSGFTVSSELSIASSSFTSSETVSSQNRSGRSTGTNDTLTASPHVTSQIITSTTYTTSQHVIYTSPPLDTLQLTTHSTNTISLYATPRITTSTTNTTSLHTTPQIRTSTMNTITPYTTSQITTSTTNTTTPDTTPQITTSETTSPYTTPQITTSTTNTTSPYTTPLITPSTTNTTSPYTTPQITTSTMNTTSPYTTYKITTISTNTTFPYATSQITSSTTNTHSLHTTHQIISSTTDTTFPYATSQITSRTTNTISTHTTPQISTSTMNTTSPHTTTQVTTSTVNTPSLHTTPHITTSTMNTIYVHTTPQITTSPVNTTSQHTPPHITTSSTNTTSQHTTLHITTSTVNTTSQHTKSQITTSPVNTTSPHTTPQITTSPVNTISPHPTESLNTTPVTTQLTHTFESTSMSQNFSGSTEVFSTTEHPVSTEGQGKTTINTETQTGDETTLEKFSTTTTKTSATTARYETDCGALSISNANVNDSATTYGTVVEITCKEGYNISGNTTVECQADGVWSGSAICDPVDCGSQFNISDGTISLTNDSDTTYGASAEVNCDYGYETNASTIYCQIFGVWENSVCTKKDCGPVPEIMYGNATLSVENETTFGAQATVVCETGYTTEIVNNLYEVFYIYCRGSGEWDNRTCSITDCGQLPNDTFYGELTLDNEGITTYGATATLKCVTGYETSMPNITCQTLGAWSEFENCVVKDCNAVPNIYKGTVILAEDGNTTYGALANVTCEEGYNTSTEIIQCLDTGTWENTTCEKIDCGMPPNDTMYGELTLDNEGITTYGATATLNCVVGYETSTPNITCQKLGTWSEFENCVVKDCNAVPDIYKGTVTLAEDGNTTYGALANVTCGEGYNTSMEMIQCLDTGTWENATCKMIDCGTPPNNTMYGELALDNEGITTYGATATLNCVVGYETSTPIITCQKLGTWSEFENCVVKDCNVVPDIYKGTVTLAEDGNTTYGALANVTCEEGYNTSMEIIQCLDIGTWENATCEIIDCDDPRPTYGIANDTSTYYGAVIKITCYQGFNITGNSSIICQSNGKWSDNPTCEIIDCGDPSPENGGVDFLIGKTFYGDVAFITCDEGYTPSYNSSISCQANGTWSSLPGCLPKDCGPLTAILNGESVLGDTANSTFGATATVICDTGYIANTTNITCLASGKWEVAKCSVVDCKNVTGISQGTAVLLEDGNTTYGAYAAVTCETGYNASLDTIQCLEAGGWENSTCELIDCGPLTAIINGESVLGDTTNSTYGATATVTCDTGYIANTTNITCLASGKWEVAKCSVVDCKNVTDISQGTAVLLEDGNTTYGAYAAVTCETGYNASLDTIQCLEAGGWENSTCELIDCGPLTAILNGESVLGDTTNSTFGATATVTCDTGYIANTTNITCLASGKWEEAKCYVVDCKNVTDISQGTAVLLDDGNTTYGAYATVTCETGYNASLDTIQCLEAGGWENSTCDLIDCGPLTAILNGESVLGDTTNSTFGATATVTCDTGYIANTTNITCLASGKWEEAKCYVVDCKNVPDISQGTAVLLADGNTTYGAYAAVNCEAGYNASLDTIKCFEAGGWENSTCELIDCNDVPDITKGTVTLVEDGNTTYGALANLTCDNGYNASSKTIQCLDTGRWEATTCEVVDCNTIPVIADGNITLLEDENTTYGALAEVTCAKGYNTSLDVIQCLETGDWDIPSCDVIDCSDVPDVTKGTVTLVEDSNTTYGALANVTCEDGYNASSETIQCLDTGKWEATSCEIVDCKMVSDIQNGTITLLEGGNTTYGALANVSCEIGYNASVDIIQCTKAGIWESSTCEIIDCKSVPDITMANVTLAEDGHTSYGAVAYVSCENGYNNSLGIIRCLETGRWEIPICEKIDCNTIPVVADGTIKLLVEGNTTYGALAEVTCEKGYNTTLDVIQCLETGDWEIPSCDIIDCNDVPDIIKGTVTLVEDSNTNYGALANVTCEDGYNASSETIQCLDTGKWDTTTCEIVDCNDVPDITKGTVALVEDSNTTYGALANVTCEDGYNASSKTIQCLDTGKWEATTCEIVDCSILSDIPNGTVTLLEDGNTTYGALANVSCETGYNATVDIIKCTKAGMWEISTCEKIDCKSVPDITMATVTLAEDGNTRYGAVAYVACENGYNNSLEIIRCLETGSWEIPICEKIDCGELENPTNGAVNISKGTTFGATASYSCDEGFTLVGDETRNCGPSGKWSNMKPDCAQQGDRKCSEDTDSRGTVWNEIAAGKTRIYDCKTNFTGSKTRHCDTDGTWAFPKYECIRETVKNAVSQSNLLNKNATQLDVRNVLQDLKGVTSQDESIEEGDKLTDLEMTNLVTSSVGIAELLSSSPDLLNADITNDFTEYISNLLDPTNIESWNAISQTSSSAAESVLSSVDTLGEALGKYVASSGTALPPVVKKNIAVQVKQISSDEFVFPGSDAKQDTVDGIWLVDTKSKVQFNPDSLQGETDQEFIVTAAMYKDLSDILPDKSEDEKLNGQIVAFSTWPPVSGEINPPVTITFEQTNDDTGSSGSYWQFSLILAIQEYLAIQRHAGSSGSYYLFRIILAVQDHTGSSGSYWQISNILAVQDHSGNLESY